MHVFNMNNEYLACKTRVRDTSRTGNFDVLGR
jgi:hypothetical protein